MRYMEIRQWISILVLFAFIAIGFILTGCGGKDDENVGNPTEIQFKIQLPDLAPFSAVSSITVTVTSGPNDDKVLGTAILTIQGNTATGTVTVLAGKDRVFTVEAKDENGTIIGSGVQTADVTIGQTNTVNIPIQFKTADVIINAQLGDQPDGNTNPNSEILPGEGVAKIKLMDTFSKVKSLYGTPALDPKYPDMFGYEKIGLLGIVLDSDDDKVIDDSEPVIVMMVIDPYKGKTAGGNGLGSSRADIEKELGPPPSVEPDNENKEETLVYENKGIDLICSTDTNTKPVVAIFIYFASKGAPQNTNSIHFNRQLRMLKRQHLMPSILNHNALN